MTIKLALTATEAAEATGLGVDTIRAAIRAGHLRAKRSGKTSGGEGAGNYVIPVASLTDWLDSLEDA